jgi:GWxTD domain-containing protein
VIRRAAAVLSAVFLLGAGCGPLPRGDGADAPRSGNTVPRLFDASSAYRSMGFLVGGGSLPFVASVRYLRGPAPDSTLALVALSLANQALTFQRSGTEFRAAYRVEATFRADSGLAPVQQIGRDEQVRVRAFQETLRGDESVIFQQFVTLSPGVYQVQVTVRDRNGPAFSRSERADTVPRFTGRGITRPIPVYEAQGRTEASAFPALLANPRATVPYGGDTVRFYVEAYGGGAPAPARLVARILYTGDRELWRDTVAFTGDARLRAATVVIAPGRLPVGNAQVETIAADGGDTTRAPFLVSFSNQWVITNFDELLSMLRYFDAQTWVDSLRKAPAEKRSDIWQAFWKATDPVPITPENEALDNYFRRVQLANLRFQNEGIQGWLTDRGQVFITLGDPDEVLDLSSGMDRSGQRVIRWTYTPFRLVLYFTDHGGFNRFRLTPASRAEYQRVLVQVRRSQ